MVIAFTWPLNLLKNAVNQWNMQSACLPAIQWQLLFPLAPIWMVLLYISAIRWTRFIPPRKKFPPDYVVLLAQASFLAG